MNFVKYVRFHENETLSASCNKVEHGMHHLQNGGTG